MKKLAIAVMRWIIYALPYLGKNFYKYKERKWVATLPKPLTQMTLQDYAIAKALYPDLEYLTDTDAMIEAAVLLYPDHFKEATATMITNIGSWKYTYYCDKQNKLRKDLEMFDFDGDAYEPFLLCFARCIRTLSIMQSFEKLFQNLDKAEDSNIENNAYDFMSKYGEYGAILSIADAYKIPITECENYTAMQILVTLDYLSNKAKADIQTQRNAALKNR